MSRASRYNFDIDSYLNPFIPRNRLYLLPKPISHFLGYRPSNHTQKGGQLGSLLVWVWSFIGAVCGILVAEAVFHAPSLSKDGAPIIIGSLGASAILLYTTPSSPLSQPRNAILGQLFSSVIGVAIAKLFLLSPNFSSIRFVGGALAVAISSVVMGFTKTVHPPGGATALLAVVSDEVLTLGWLLVGLIVLGSALMVGVGCVVGNLGAGRRYPVYWWTGEDLGSRKESLNRSGSSDEGGRDVENGDGGHDHEKEDVEEIEEIEGGGRDLILIDGRDVSVPGWMSLSEQERDVLEGVRERLERGLEMRRSRGSQATFVGEVSGSAGGAEPGSQGKNAEG